MKTHLLNAGVLSAMLFASDPAAAQFFNFGRNTGQEQSRDTVRQAASELAAQHEPWMQEFVRRLHVDGEWGAVLNFQRLGLAAMEHKRFDLARRAFDQAIVRVEEIYAGDANAEKARSVFNGEAVKDFKGEPYERAMLYYYRGLLYAHEGDWQNARASFLAADRHITLSSAESASYSSDFGLLKYLAGWASYCDGDVARGEQLVAEARAMNNRIMSLPQRPGAAVALIDSGPAPVKWGDGEYKHILKFKAGDGPDIAPAQLQWGAQTLTAPVVAGDVLHQATSRGGREVDGVLQGKAQFKDSAGQIGDTALVVGSQVAMMGAMSGNNDSAGAGLLGMFIGLAAKAAESAANPAADVRSWESLPARIHLFSAPEPVEGEARWFATDGPRSLPLVTTAGRCSVAWGRTGPKVTVAAAADPEVNPETNRGKRNKAFRDALVQMLATRE